MGEWGIVQADVMVWAEEYDGPKFHAALLDPPYHLAGGFMGKHWDRDGPGAISFRPETWAALSQHLLPGAWLMAFGSTRGWHRLACAIEDSGMIIQPSIFVEGVGVVEAMPLLLWLTGQSFPKSTRIDAQLEKRRKDDIRPVCRFLRAKMEERGLVSRDIAPHFDFHPRMIDHWAARDTDSQPTVPTWKQWQRLKALLDFGDEMDMEVRRLNERKGKPGELWHEREVIGQYEGDAGGFSGMRMTGRDGFIREPATPLARAWEGHRYGGQILRDVACPIVCAQKPWGKNRLDDIVATGVGALWVEGGRVGTTRRTPASLSKDKTPGEVWGDFKAGGGPEWDNTNKGRWPPNYAVMHHPACQRVTVPAPCPACSGDGAEGCPDCGGSGSVERGATSRVTGTGKAYNTLRTDEYTASSYHVTGQTPDITYADLDGKESVPRYRCARHCPACGGEVCEVCGGTGTVEVGATERVKGGFAGFKKPQHFALSGYGADDVGTIPAQSGYADAGGKESVSRYACARCCGTGPAVSGVEPCGTWWLAETPTPCPECGAEGVWGCQVRRLDEGVKKTGPSFRKGDRHWSVPLPGPRQKVKGTTNVGYFDTGGPSRYYPSPDFSHETSEALALGPVRKYQAKPSRAERDAGLEMFPIDEQQATLDGGEFVKRDKRAGRNRRGAIAARNPHPTVKSIALTKWLATLLLPPAIYAPRRLLVPFCGTFSEGLGGLLAGWEYVLGIDSKGEYCEIGEARARFWSGWSERTGATEPKAILKASRRAQKQAAKAEAEDNGQMALGLPK